MVWQPVNLTENCPADSPLTACTSFGFIYLNLLVQLYGDSKDRRIQRKLEVYEEKIDREEACLLASRRHGKKRDEYNKDLSFQRDGAKKRKYVYEYVEDLEKRLSKCDKDGFKIKHGGEIEEYDFIVVGAGSAGCIVANRLTDYNFKVLLLEAGPEQPDVTLVPALSTGLPSSNLNWGFKTQPDGKSCLAQKNQQCNWPAGRVMGGSSSINSMAYVRGNKLDYDNWADMGNDGWAYRDVLPFFKKSEKNLDIVNLDRKYHGVDGPQSISQYPYIDIPSKMLIEAFHQKGLPVRDINGENQLGTAQGQAFTQGGERVSTNNAYIQPIRYKRKNLIVKVKSEAVKILLHNKTAYGIVYNKNNKLHTALATKEVIISSGTINSAKLLMLSGIGPKEHLNELGIKTVQNLSVGRNLQDHVSFEGMLIALPNETATVVSNKQILDEVVKYSKMEIKEGPLSGNGPETSLAFFKTDDSLPAPDIQYQVLAIHSWQEYVKDPVGYKGLRIFPTTFYNGIIAKTKGLTPKSRGRVYLNSTDSYANPVIFANYFDDENDLKVLIEGVKFLVSLENSTSFKEKGAYFVKESLEPCEDFKWGTDDYIVCMARHHTSTTYHMVGTCKMGPKSDECAVVDPRLKVHGINGLRVIDASIMPVVPRGNTNAPTMMVAERGVDFVLEEWLGEKYCILNSI